MNTIHHLPGAKLWLVNNVNTITSDATCAASTQHSLHCQAQPALTFQQEHWLIGKASGYASHHRCPICDVKLRINFDVFCHATSLSLFLFTQNPGGTPSILEICTYTHQHMRMFLTNTRTNAHAHARVQLDICLMSVLKQGFVF